jgi:hypothetical protein
MKVVFGIFKSSRSTTDLAVVDQYAGPTMVCEWLQFAEMPFEKSGFIVSICSVLSSNCEVTCFRQLQCG